jgi:uncharacterized protein (UPF0333 family)
MEALRYRHGDLITLEFWLIMVFVVVAGGMLYVAEFSFSEGGVCIRAFEGFWGCY